MLKSVFVAELCLSISQESVVWKSLSEHWSQDLRRVSLIVNPMNFSNPFCKPDMPGFRGGKQFHQNLEIRGFHSGVSDW